MNPRTGISILVCCIGICSVQGQTTKKDSLQSQKEGEIYINQEAVKSIEFNFLPPKEIMNARPKMDETKPWMEFRKDLPSSLTDTTTLRKRKYIRMLPYSIWGHDQSYLLMNKDSLIIRMQLNPENIKPLPGMGHGYRVVPEGMDQSVTPSNRPVTGFSADKLLFENLTKRGRAIKRNRKKAKAWKIYKDYVPTKEVSLKLYRNKKRIPKDTLTLLNKDSINHFINTK